jgi:pimeloyl-ACP methyl ester carboxylesterase
MSQKLKCFIDGDKNAAETIVFVHGWPDNESLFAGLVSEFKSTYRCVTVQLPNFGSTIDEPWGVPFEELTSRLHKTVVEIMRPNEKQVIVCCHDWGCTVAYAFEKAHPELVSRMIGFDIGPHVKPGVIDFLFIIVYQVFLLFFHKHSFNLRNG